MTILQVLSQHDPKRFDPIFKTHEKYGPMATMDNRPDGDWVSYVDYSELKDCLYDAMIMLEKAADSVNSIQEMRMQIATALNG